MRFDAFVDKKSVHFKIDKDKWNKKTAKLQWFDERNFHFVFGFRVMHIVKFNRAHVGYKFMRQ